jgi:choline dehydrogenase-like flavoprotein
MSLASSVARSSSILLFAKASAASRLGYCFCICKAELPDKLRRGYVTAADILPSDHDWRFIGRATADAEPMLVPRGRVTGGSSAINGEIFLRGVAEDFDGWAAQGNDRWSFAQVLPFYCRLERDLDFEAPYHGADGPIPVVRWPREQWLPAQHAFYAACVAAGCGVRGPQCAGRRRRRSDPGKHPGRGALEHVSWLFEPGARAAQPGYC